MVGLEVCVAWMDGEPGASRGMRGFGGSRAPDTSMRNVIPPFNRTTQVEATARVQALAIRVLADRLEHGELSPEFATITFAAA